MADDMAQNLLEEQQADYQHFVTTGSHYEIGMITARQAGTALDFGRNLNPSQLKFAEQCRELTQQIYPEMVEEFAGYAKALDLPEEALLGHYSLGVTGGCSAVAVQTPQGMIVGRNYDFFYFENRRHLINTQPDKGFSHIGLHEGLIGARFDGLNEKGLFVSFNGAGPHPDPSQIGLTFPLVIRYLLERCASADEAKQVLLELPLKEPKSYLLADRDHAYVVEVHPERRAARELQDGMLIVTNHFIHPDMRSYAPEWPNSVARYNYLAAEVPALKTELTDPEQKLQALMADHTAPICGHREGLATFWSCTANLQTGQINYALGAPCRNQYKNYFQPALTV